MNLELLLQLMQKQDSFARTAAQARNIFQTEFHPQPQEQDFIGRILRMKLLGQYKPFLTKIKTDKHHQDKGKDKQKQDENAVTKIIQQINEEGEKKGKIKTFDKYEANIGDSVSDLPVERSLVVSNKLQMNLAQSTRLGSLRSSSLRRLIKPTWHPPFKLYRVIVGHQGWVRCLAVSPCNTFFASGSADRTIKFWDMASGQLKISLTGHINTIRAIQFSKFHPYLFSCGQDKSVKCWDLQMNKVIRNYHGHLSGVYCLKIHDNLGVLVTGGRDSTARVWDIRVRRQIHALVGHAHTVGSILTQQSQPHVITGSYDSFIKMWDVGTGKCIKTLTNHKKSIRAMVEHPKQYTFASAASDNIKVWKCPQGQFLRNVAGHNSIIDSLAINQDGVLVSGGDDGSLKFWDWKSGYNYQDSLSQPQPGSIAAENGIFALTFDKSGSRLLSGECDKTIKMWKEDQTATQESHPIKQFKMEFGNS